MKRPRLASAVADIWRFCDEVCWTSSNEHITAFPNNEVVLFIFYHDAVIVKLVGLFSIQFSLWKLYLPQSIYINDRFTDIHFFMSLIQRGNDVI